MTQTFYKVHMVDEKGTLMHMVNVPPLTSTGASQMCDVLNEEFRASEFHFIVKRALGESNG